MVSASSFWTRCLAEIGIGWFGIFVFLYGELWGLGLFGADATRILAKYRISVIIQK